MKNLLIFVKILILTIVVGQSPDTTALKATVGGSIKFDSSTEVKIQTAIRENEKALEEIKQLKLQNDKDLLAIKQMEEERKKIKKSNSRLVDLILKMKSKPSKTEIVYVKKNDIINKNSIKTDSTCISYNRGNIFGKKKCDKWEVTRYVLDSDNNRIFLK